MRKVSFIVGVFPAASETFVTGQVAGLIDRGVEVNIFSFQRGDSVHASADYENYAMAGRTTYMDFPEKWMRRALVAGRAAFRLLRHNPVALIRAMNIFRYGAEAWSLRLLCWAGPLAGLNADLVHCHFGPIADRFVIIRDILGLRQPWITTFYGADVGVARLKGGPEVYKKLARECPKFLVMSEDMKRRIVALGFDERKVTVLPVGINPDDCIFRERTDHEDPVRLAMVGRFVEKKGIDDLIRALAYARTLTKRLFTCTIVGDGHLHDELHALAHREQVDDIVAWKGFLKQEDMLHILECSDIYVQPSKTGPTGDME